MTRRQAKRAARAERHQRGTCRTSAACDFMCTAAERHYGERRTYAMPIHEISTDAANAWLADRVGARS